MARNDGFFAAPASTGLVSVPVAVSNRETYTPSEPVLAFV